MAVSLRVVEGMHHEYYKGVLSGKNLHRLLDLRARIRTDATTLPLTQQRRLLRVMQATRRQRLPGPRPPERELAAGEVLREIKWLVGTLSLEEAEAAVTELARLQQTPRRAGGRR